MSEFLEREIIDTDNPELRFEVALCGLQEMQKRIDSGQYTSQEISDRVQPFAREIYSIATGKIMYISGPDIQTPRLDQFGHVIGREKSELPTSGFFDGISIENSNGIRDAEKLEGVTIGLTVFSGAIRFDSGIEETSIRYRVFAPVASSMFSLDSEGLTVQPEDDDEMAADIDDFLLNEPVDLDGLAQYVAEFFDKLNDLQKQHYIDYINSLFEFETIETKATRIIDLEEHDLSNLPESAVIKGYFTQFDIYEIQDEDDNDCLVLIAVLESSSGNHYGVIVNDMEEVKFE